MRSPPRPVFLDPDRYRKRRLMDAARMLPVLGVFLLFLPVLWLPDGSAHSTASDGVYLFSVWAGLILFARLFAPGLSSGDPSAEDLGAEDPDAEDPHVQPSVPDDRRSGG